MLFKWSLPVLLLAVAVEAQAGFTDEKLTLDIDGYWKARGVYVRNVFLGQATSNDVVQQGNEKVDGRLRSLEHTGYWQHHMRLQPSFSFRKAMILRMDVDVLDGVVWGDNNAVASTPLFAGAPSNTQLDGTEVSTIEAKRVWLELNVPVGIIKVGRMPSNWGMGLLANDGDGLDGDFGDYSNGSTVDRVLFVTKPVSIFKALAGSSKTKSNLIMGVAFDQLVEDPQADDEPDAERLCPDCSPNILVANPNDDVTEVVGIAVYKNDKADLLTKRDLVQVGTYVVLRKQALTGASVLIADLHVKLRLAEYGFETELLSISGDMGDAVDTGDNPKSASITGGAARAGYYGSEWEFEFEGGYAPGDTEPTDKDFTGFPFHADYNVGLIMYKHTLAAATASAWGRETRGLWSKGGVWNSKFFYPKFRWHPKGGVLDGLTVVGAVLTATANKDTSSTWFESASEPGPGDLSLGWEVDVSARYDFYGYAHFKLESGIFFPGRGLWKDVAPAAAHDLRITDEDKADTAWTVQARLGMDL